MRADSPALGPSLAERAGMFDARTVTDAYALPLSSVVIAPVPRYPVLRRRSHAKVVLLAVLAVVSIGFSTLVVRPSLIDPLCHDWAGAAPARGLRDAARAIHDVF